VPPIPGEWIIQGGAVAVLAVVFLLVMTGRLVPVRTVKQLEQDRNYWREAALKSLAHIEALIPAARIAAAGIKALSDATTSEEGSS